jgi:hypothetical protein
MCTLQRVTPAATVLFADRFAGKEIFAVNSLPTK